MNDTARLVKTRKNRHRNENTSDDASKPICAALVETQDQPKLHVHIADARRVSALTGARRREIAKRKWANAQDGKLVWDSMSKEYTGKPGERYAEFKFWFTNNSPEEVYIIRAQSSCFCTVAQLPQTPWRIPPGTNGSIDVKMDLAGKNGIVSKGVNVDTTGGPYALSLKTTIMPAAAPPGMADADRWKDM